MFRRMMVLLLALALSALPFGMGAMMAAQAGMHHGHADMSGPGGMHSHHHAIAGSVLPHAGNGNPPDSGEHHGSHAKGGAHIHFAACGSCVSLAPAGAHPLLIPARGRLPEAPVPSPPHSHETLPALPPPRA